MELVRGQSLKRDHRRRALLPSRRRGRAAGADRRRPRLRPCQRLCPPRHQTGQHPRRRRTAGRRLVDFGIAKGLADGDLTEAGEGLGTVGYLAPEQAAGLMATPASDVYSRRCRGVRDADRRAALYRRDTASAWPCATSTIARPRRRKSSRTLSRVGRRHCVARAGQRPDASLAVRGRLCPGDGEVADRGRAGRRPRGGER